MLRLNRLCLPVCQISPFLIRPPGGGHLLPGGILVQLRRAPFGFQGTSCGRRRRVRPPGRTCAGCSALHSMWANPNLPLKAGTNLPRLAATVSPFC